MPNLTTTGGGEGVLRGGQVGRGRECDQRVMCVLWSAEDPGGPGSRVLPELRLKTGDLSQWV